MGNKIALVVLNYNNATETSNFVRSISAFKEIEAIQIVDNASTDCSYDELSFTACQLKSRGVYLAESPTNNGYGSGNNFAVSQLKLNLVPDYLVIANPDIRLSESAVSAMAHFLDEHDGYASVAPVMVNANGEVCQSAWKLPTIKDMWINAARLMIGVIRDPLDYGGFESFASYETVEVLPGSLFMIRLSDFDGVGGFDEDTFLYGEENLLFSRLRQAGRKSALLLSESYIHAHGSSINKEIASVRRRYLMLLDSNLIYCKKVLRMSKLVTICYRFFFLICLWVFLGVYSISSILKRKRGEN